MWCSEKTRTILAIEDILVIDLCGIIGRLNKKMTLSMCGMQPESEMSNETDAEPSNEGETSHNKHPPELEDDIKNERAVAAIDASMYGNLMASHWTTTSLENQIRTEGGVETTKWENGMIPLGEVLGSLALANDTVNKTRNLNQGEVMVCSDNDHV